jgi:MFS family permease
MDNGIAPNAKRLLWAGFMAILAAGMGFGIRGGILANWSAEFGFTGAQLGMIGGAGFTGFCFGIIIGGVIVDKVGYGKLVLAAFALHVLSAFVTFGATPGMEQAAAYRLLYWGMFIFAVANGTLEAVANPLVATLFPNKRTHYLNILHASWPAGMVFGGMVGWYLGGNLGWGWQPQLALYLVPTVAYGLMFLGQSFPQSEASQRGLSLGEMFKDVGILGGLVVCFLLALFFRSVFGPMFPAESAAPTLLAYGISGALLLVIVAITKAAVGHWMLFLLFVAHALVGAVELGTDGWIQNITGNILTPNEGKILFVFTSAVMFALRFCADFIEHRIGLSPIGLLLACALLAFAGLNLVSAVNAFGPALGALTVYAIGKTFFWPTMLAIVSDRFPQTGAVAISIMGGIGMLSAGLIGTPGLGYAKDRFASEELQRVNPGLYAEYRAGNPSHFLFFDEVHGLDGRKLGEAKSRLEAARAERAAAGDTAPLAALDQLSEEERAVLAADIAGDRRTLVADSAIPAALAVIYLFLLLYFRAIGGYRPIHIVEGLGEATAAAGAGAPKTTTPPR